MWKRWGRNATRESLIITMLVVAIPVVAAVGVLSLTGAVGMWTFWLGVAVGGMVAIVTSGKVWCYLMEDFVALPMGACCSTESVSDLRRG